MGYNMSGAPIQMMKGPEMQKKKILIPLAACAMLLPMTANACGSANACFKPNYDCSANCCEMNYTVGNDCCENTEFSSCSLCCDPDQVMFQPQSGHSAGMAALSVVSQSSSASAEILRQVNEYRARYGLGSLSRSAELDRAAALRASEISKVFSHTRPDGSSWSTVSGSALGENIAKGYRSAAKTMAAWMSSNGHRANILRSSFGSIGIAAVEINGVMYWIQLFGR